MSWMYILKKPTICKWGEIMEKGGIYMIPEDNFTSNYLYRFEMCNARKIQVQKLMEKNGPTWNRYNDVKG